MLSKFYKQIVSLLCLLKYLFDVIWTLGGFYHSQVMVFLPFCRSCIKLQVREDYCPRGAQCHFLSHQSVALSTLQSCAELCPSNAALITYQVLTSLTF